MVFLRATLIVVGITTIAASATASLAVPGDSLVGGDNRTATMPGDKVVLAAAPKLYSYCGADIIGGDLFSKRFPSPDDCVTNCFPSTGCNAGTWTRFEGGTCYFKRVTKAPTGYLNTVPNAGAVSFLLKDASAPSQVPLTGIYVDMPGNDFANAPTSGADECYKLCTSTERCSAFTYTHTASEKRCYLKTKTSPYVELLGAISSVVPHARNAAACLAYL